MNTKRSIVLGAVAGLAGAALPAKGQTAYPVKPIRLVVPFPPGGATDILGRAMAQKISESIGQQVVVDNKPGAGGTIGSDLAAKSAPDGYTILLATTSTHCIGPILNSKIPYNVERDFAPVVYAANATNVLIVPNELPVRNLAEFVAYTKARPGQLNFGSSGNGTIVHLTAEYFANTIGARLVHIPYKGTALVIPDLIAGQINLVFDSIVSVLPHIRNGKVKPLGISSARRSPLVPDLPTMQEAGVPGFESGTRFGFYAPAGTPAPIITRLNAEINKALGANDLRERLGALGAEPVGGTPEQFATAMRADSTKWAKVVKDAGVRVE